MPNVADPVRLIRLNISDLNTENPLLSNEDLELVLESVAGSVNRASAKALRVIASSEVLRSKKISTQDLSTDGPAVSQELRALADTYDEAAAAEESTSEGALHFSKYRPGGVRREAESRRVI